MRLGLVVILVGIVYLLRGVGLITMVQWGILWPIIIIYIGIAMVSRHRCWHCGVWHENQDMHKRDACDCEDCVKRRRKS
jgi:hypothetical protein